MTDKTLVMKFGGTSVGSAAAVVQAAQIVAATAQQWPRLVVVTSALSGVTDLLLETARTAVEAGQGAGIGRASSAAQAVAAAAQTLRTRHTDLARAVTLGEEDPHPGPLPVGEGIKNPSPFGRRAGMRENPGMDTFPLDSLLADLNGLVDEFEQLCRAVGVLGEASPRALDAIASLGERLSVRILAAALQARGLPAQVVESTRLIVTDGRFTNAAPDLPATTRQARRELEPLLQAGCIPVVTGFLGATPQGFTTTLGRGGSDTSASILALALGAAEVWIWTDVDGVMTADPRLVPEARTIPILSYREVAEMAYYGAKVLHPRSIYPALEAGIPLRVRNTFNPCGPDTCLGPEHGPDGSPLPASNGRGHLKAVTAIRGLQMVTLSGRGMLGVPGVAGRIFTAVATTGVSIPLIIESTSEQSICFAAPGEAIPAVLAALRRDLGAEFARRDIDCAEAGQEISIITLICPGIRSTVGIAGRIFGVLGQAGINVQAISYGSSDYSISLVVAAGDLPSAVRSLHALVD